MYYIQHSGVKGMKWGVRHDRTSSGSGKYTLKKKQQNKSSTNETKKKGLSSSTKKKIAIGIAAAAGTAVAAYCIKKRVDAGRLKADSLLDRTIYGGSDHEARGKARMLAASEKMLRARNLDEIHSANRLADVGYNEKSASKHLKDVALDVSKSKSIFRSRNAKAIDKTRQDLNSIFSERDVDFTKAPKTTIRETPIGKINIDSIDVGSGRSIDMYVDELLKKNGARLKKYGY